MEHKGLVFKNVYHHYKGYDDGRGDKYSIRDISLTVKPGEYLAIVGQTGSGKSTLLQHMNGLLKPDRGSCLYDGQDIHSKEYSLRVHRQKVALCFQYPEYQLFEETVLKDICFGPKNQGLSQEECLNRARYAMELLGLSRKLEEVSPFLLSGGQKRKAALAGILAMEPEMLLLDEPAAGLDYESKTQLFALLDQLNARRHMTVLLVSHDMDEVAAHARRVIVMNRGAVLADGSPAEILGDEALMEQAGLSVSSAAAFYHALQGKLTEKFRGPVPVTPEQLADFIVSQCTSKTPVQETSAREQEKKNDSRNDAGSIL